MNKSELIKEVAHRLNESVQTVRDIVDTLLETVTEELVKERDVRLVGFGTFEVRHRSARQGRHPKTGETISIPATRTPAFSPGSYLSNAVKGRK
jgi:DNA-binding protein HU-beta